MDDQGQKEVLEILQKVGAFRSGHFVFTSGRHGDAYINKDALYPYTEDTSKLCKMMAERFAEQGVEVVIGPAIGAAILAQWTAHHLQALEKREVYAVYADKDGQGGFILKRGYDAVAKGKKALVVEDLTTTGGSIRKVVEVARACGADVIGAIAICNRGDVKKADVGNPPVFLELLDVHLESWEAEDCDLCKRGIPVNTDVGHGKEFLAKKEAGTGA